MGIITFYDENLFIKKKKALGRYFRKGYKYLLFEVLPKLKEDGKIDGMYEVEIPTEDLFEQVYGKMYLKFSVKNDVAFIEDIVPNDILIACYEKDLPIYKGIPYNSKKDLFKIKTMEGICQK